MPSLNREILDPPADFELGRPRPAPLSYVADFPDQPARGLVFVIPGFGADADAGYAAGLRRHIVREHAMAAVSVRYHGFGSRPETGAALSIGLHDHLMLLGLAALHGLSPSEPADVRSVVAALKAGGVEAQTYGVLTPARDEYQNFGVLQAMDHLAVLADLLRDGPAFDAGRIVALGSSHGGFIAHMIAKFAPRTLAMVVDNSSYTRPPPAYLGLTQGGDWFGDVGGVTVHCRTAGGWSLDDPEAPEFYGPDRSLIRDASYRPHLATARAASQDGGTQFRMVNAAVDPISPPGPKQRQLDALRAAGFDAKLLIVEAEHLDGQLFKAMTHGLDASLAGLLALGLQDLEPRSGPLDCQAGAAIAYEGIDQIYRFVHGGAAPDVAGACTPRFP
jgi:hypothetical protein